MRLALFIAVLQICDCRHHSKSKPRSINLVLETIMEFDNNDNSADIKIIDKVQGFLNKVKHVIDKNYRKRYSDRDLTFTDFIKNCIIILNGYKDEDLEELIAVVEDEVWRYKYRGCKFYELIDNHDVRRFMANKLDQIKTTSVKKIRDEMNVVLDNLQEENLGIKLKMIIKYFNSLYDPEDTKKFSEVLDNLSLYKNKTQRSTLDLVKIVRNSIRSIIFDHYSNFDADTRGDLKVKLETFWRDYVSSDKLDRPVWQIDFFTRVEPTLHRLKTYNKHGNLTSLETAETFTTKQLTRTRKRKTTEEEKLIERDSNKKNRSTKKQKLTFITLYPEAITFKERYQRLKSEIKQGAGTVNNEPMKTHARHQPKDDNETIKKTLPENKTSNLIERPRFTIDVDSDYEQSYTTPKKMRYNFERRHPNVKQFGRLSKAEQKTVRGPQKSNVELIIESAEGISIEFNNRKPFRKSNDNGSFSLTTTKEAVTDLNITTTKSNIKQETVQLEELKVVTSQILVENSTSTTKSVTETVIKTPINKTIPTTIRSRDITINVKENNTKLKQTKKGNKMKKLIPKTTRNNLRTTRKALVKKNMTVKLDILKRLSTSPVPFYNQMPTLYNIPSKKYSENEVPDDYFDNKDIFEDLETFLNDNNHVDDKSEKVKQKMKEDFEKMMSDIVKTNNVKSLIDATIIPTIGVDDRTDPFDIINDSI